MAGTVTRSSAIKRGYSGGQVFERVVLAWVCTAGGAVSANSFTPPVGKLVQATFIPDGGGTQPSDLYDITLVDANAIDYLAGAGANLSNATPTVVTPTVPKFTDGVLTLDLVVANAGNAKGGTVVLLFQLK